MRSEGKKRTLELSLIQGFSKIEKLFGGATRNRTGNSFLNHLFKYLTVNHLLIM
jgi:hypothetical protein